MFKKDNFKRFLFFSGKGKNGKKKEERERERKEKELVAFPVSMISSALL